MERIDIGDLVQIQSGVPSWEGGANDGVVGIVVDTTDFFVLLQDSDGQRYGVSKKQVLKLN